MTTELKDEISDEELKKVQERIIQIMTEEFPGIPYVMLLDYARCNIGNCCPVCTAVCFADWITTYSIPHGAQEAAERMKEVQNDEFGEFNNQKEKIKFH